jgi:hypothetical protein
MMAIRARWMDVSRRAATAFIHRSFVVMVWSAMDSNIATMAFAKLATHHPAMMAAYAR